MPTPVPTSSATATPSPNPSPPFLHTPASILDARLLPLGSYLQIEGRLLTPLGLVDQGRGAYVADDTAGIALRLDAANWAAQPAGTDVVVTGMLIERAGEMTVELGWAQDIAAIGSGPLPYPFFIATGLACEPLESRVVSVDGIVVDVVSAVTGAIATNIDDGSGPLAVLAPDGSGISAEQLELGRRLQLTGVLSQINDAPQTYRLVLRSADDVVPVGIGPTPSPTSSPPPSPTPSPTPLPTPSATPIPTQTAGPTSIADARAAAIGSTVHVRGTVTVAAGVILGDTTAAIQDLTGGIPVRFAADDVPAHDRGSVIDIVGVVAAPYGNLELRVGVGQAHVVGTASEPGPSAMVLSQVGESMEGWLVRSSGTILAIDDGSTGSLTLTIADDSGQSRVFFHPPLGVTRSDFHTGQTIDATGIVGDRLGLYRIWPRTRADVRVTAQPPTPMPSSTPSPSGTPQPTHTPQSTPTPTPHPTNSPTASQSPSQTASPTPGGTVLSIADALRRPGQAIVVEGTVTARPGLLDASNERVTIQDSSAAILLRVPADSTVSVGQRVRIAGVVATYYGAPQLTATSLAVLGQGTIGATVVRSAPIAAQLEWNLVSVSGTVTTVHRDGDAWRAEITIAGGSIPIVGLDRSGIASTALEAGRDATVTGLVKRAYPTAADQRLAVVPRSASDISARGNSPTSSPLASGFGPTSTPIATPRPDDSTGGSPTAGSSAWPFGPQVSAAPGSGDGGPYLVAIGDLAGHVGERVRIGGKVSSVVPPVMSISDGSATAAVRLSGAAAALIGEIRGGDVVNVVGTVTRTAAGGIEVVVDDPTDVMRATGGGGAIGTVELVSLTTSAGGVAFAGDSAPASDPRVLLVGVAVALILVAAFVIGMTWAGPARRDRWRKKLLDTATRLRLRLGRNVGPAAQG